MRNIFLLIVFSIQIIQILCGQKKSRQYYTKLEKANYEFNNENYHLALPIFSELYTYDTTNIEVCYKLGKCIFIVRRESQESFNYFYKAKNKFPAANFYLGRLYHLQQKFDKALEAYNEALNSPENIEISKEEIYYYMQKTYVAKELVLTKSNARIQNLVELNTPFPEYAPLLNPEENRIYFTSRRKGSTGNKLDNHFEYFEDIYVAYREQNKIIKIENVGYPLNTELHDATVTISKDGKQLYIFRTSPGLTKGRILVSEFSDNKWSDPIVCDLPFGNGTVTSMSISPDLNTIYFASDMPGGYGQKDIYRITKMPDGSWSKPMNLGPSINTPYDEDAPFIHPDGVSLFFSSKGHQNMGGYDIFVSYLNDDGSWSTPQNLAPPINSVYDDIYFIATFDGKTIYFSSNREEGNGSLDIYKGEIIDPEKNRIIFKGTIITTEPEYKPVKSTITVLDFDTKEVQGVYRTNNNGKYILVLLPRKKYKLIVEAENYYPYSTEIDIKEKIQLEDMFKTIILTPIVKEEIIVSPTENQINEQINENENMKKNNDNNDKNK
ncbi:MAG: hypothetical protein N3A01_05280 [Bacteroidales bacterium]|nr:hypothetical protein [Bacteroidales bacterium]